MVALPNTGQDISERIYKAYVKENKKARPFWLGLLGASSIGEECTRKTFFDWRVYLYGENEGRVLRLFNTGFIQENRVIEDLRKAGFPVWDIDPQTGKQYKFLHESGHLVAKLDGVIKDVPGAEKTPHLLEIKSHNDNNFKQLLKKTSVFAVKPEHYMQMQVGMWLSGGLTRALYAAVNKNDEQYYFERVYRDDKAIEKLEKKVETLLDATLTPAGISENQSAFGCKFCPYKGDEEKGIPNVCAGEPSPLKHCRTCSRSQPVADGEWVCTLLDLTLTQDAQQRGCEHHNPRSVYF